MKILVSLVGEQPTPNLIPLFDKRTLAGPEEGRWRAVKFLASGATWKVGENLLKALEADSNTPNSAVAGVARMELKQIEAWSLENARQNIKQALEEVRAAYPDDTIVVNFTGGTKIMSLAAYQAAVEMGVEMVYVNTEKAHISRFDKSGAPLNPPSPFETKISVETLFRAAGREIDQGKTRDVNAIAPNVRDLLWWLANNYDGAIKDCLLPVQKYIQNGLRDKTITAAPYRAPLAPNSKISQEAAGRIRDAGLWAWNGNEVSIEQSKWEFVKGGWLESYAVVALARDNQFDEVSGPLFPKGINLDKEDMPDIDALGCRNGRLALLECKVTGSQEDGGLTNILGKLRAHERLMGGLYGASVFVRASEENKTRVETWAQEYGVNVVIGRDLPQLADRVLKIIS